MDKRNIYFGQPITESEWDEINNLIEKAMGYIAGDFILNGVWAKQSVPVQRTVPSMSISIPPNTAFVKETETGANVPVRFTTELTPDLTVDRDSNPTIPSAGNLRYISVSLRYIRNEYDQRVDDNQQSIYYKRDDFYQIEVWAAAEHPTTPPRQPFDPEGGPYVLVCDILLDENVTAITNPVDPTNPGVGEIDTTRIKYGLLAKRIQREITRIADPISFGNALFINTTTNLVGFGTYTPSEKLDIIGNMELSGNVFFGDSKSLGVNGRLNFPDADFGQIRWGTDAQLYRVSTETLKILNNLEVNTKLKIISGRIGINKEPSVSYALDVSGNVNFDNTLLVSKIRINTTETSGAINFQEGITVASGLRWGDDVSLYRKAPFVLHTDGQLNLGGALSFLFDTSLERESADILRTVSLRCTGDLYLSQNILFSGDTTLAREQSGRLRASSLRIISNLYLGGIGETENISKAAENILQIDDAVWSAGIYVRAVINLSTTSSQADLFDALFPFLFEGIPMQINGTVQFGNPLVSYPAMSALWSGNSITVFYGITQSVLAVSGVGTPINANIRIVI